MNGYGLDDFIVGERYLGNEGAAYVVFGTASSVSAVNLTDIAAGTGGFEIVGEAADNDKAGCQRIRRRRATVNGDGIADMVIGANGETTAEAGPIRWRGVCRFSARRREPYIRQLG